MKNIKLKGAIFFILLFLLVGVVSASEDAFNDTLSVPDETNEMEVPQEVQDPAAAESDTQLESASDDAVKMSEEKVQPKVTVSTQTGYQGKTLTLKAVVTTDNGAVEGAKVTFKLNGNTYTAYSDANGVATYTVKFPASAALKTVSKTKKNILTKTTYYQKNYKCEVGVSGDNLTDTQTSFNVVSKKTPVVKKWKVIKKKKTVSIAVKNGLRKYIRGAYGILTYKFKYGSFTHVQTIVAKKNTGYWAFAIKHHFKQNGKWKWSKWGKYPAGYYNDFYYGSGVTLDKLQVSYTQVGYKPIK